jgi:heme A synthase
VTPLSVVVVLGALVVAALRRSRHKEIARWAAVAFVCLCVVVIAIGVHEIMTANQ